MNKNYFLIKNSIILPVLLISSFCKTYLLFFLKKVKDNIYNEINLTNIFSGVIPKNSFAKLVLLVAILFGIQGMNAQTNYYYKGTGNINATSSWGLNTDGTGAAPSNFTTANRIFNIRNAASVNLNGNWTVSPTSSKIVVGDGSSACNFTVGSNFVLTAPVDVSANATITLSTTGSITSIIFGTLNFTSTVDFASTAAQTIPVETYGNVTVSGAKTTNVTFAGSTTIAGNLTVSASSTGQLIFNSSNFARTFTISGDYIQSNFNVELGSGSGTSIINLAGDFQKTGGYMTTSSASNAKFNLNGINKILQSNGGKEIKWIDFFIPNTAIYSLNGQFNYFGSIGNNALFTIYAGGTIYCNNFNFVSSAFAQFNNNGTLGIGSTAGITTTGATGNVQTATRNYSTGANYIYNGGGNQAAGNGLPATVGSLSLDNNTILTLPSVKSVTNNFSIASGSIANLGTFTHTAGSLTLAGGSTAFGSWGSTSSSANFRNDTYFSATAGIINVGGTGTCTAGYWTGNKDNNWNDTANWCGGTLPTTSTNVVISTGVKNMPTVGAGTTANCNNISINTGATLTLGDFVNSLLNINGDFVSNGTFAAGTLSNTSFIGANQNVAGVTFGNLTLSGSGTKTFTGIITTTNLLAIQTGVVANLGTFVHPVKILTLGGAGPLVDTWGSTSSNPIAVNTNNTFFAATTGKIDINGTAPGTAIDNNFASYTNGNTGQVAGTKGENDGAVTLSAPAGTAFINVKFASYGKPGGVSPNFTIGSCHAFNSRTVTTGLLGSNIATIPASGSYNNTFGDPCYGVVKTYNVVATFAQPFCTVGGVPLFVINGSTPTGGNGSYSYLWEKSTTNATSGYTAASGTNNSISYTVPANSVSVTTWYRRTVNSGIYSDATIVIVQVVGGPPNAPTTFTATPAACDGTTTLTANGGSLGGLGGYAEFYTLEGTVETVVATSNVLPAIAIVSPITGSTTYYVRYRNSCGDTAFLSKVVTNPISITAAAIANPVCYSMAAQNASLVYTATTDTPTKYSINWDAAATTAGLVNQVDTLFAFAAGGGTINTIAIPASIPAGTYSGMLVVKKSGGCASFMNAFTLTITAVPAAPTPIATQPTCADKKGSVTFNGLPASGTIIQTGTFADTYSITGTSMTIPNFAAGSYTFTVSNGNCTSTASSAIIIKSVENKWSGSWDNGTPNSEQVLIFNSSFSSYADISGCSCEVNSGAVKINSAHTLTLTNELKVTGGSMTFENNASLVQTAAVATNNNSGPIIYKRTTPSLIETDYTYWSSPVAGQTLRISPEYDYGYMNSFNSTTNYWGYADLFTPMTFGVGYAIRGQRADNNAYTITSTFTGVPNNGTNTTPTGLTGKFVLLGNPYPSALKAEDFLDFNSNEIEGTIFFWTHKTAIQAASGIEPGKAGSGAFAYTSDDYASYNATGGVGVGGKGPNSDPSNLSLTPSGNIASGQAFFVISKGAGSVTFNNNMRVGGGASLNNNAQFFRTKSNAKTKSTIEKSRVWLDLSNSEGAFKQTLIGYVTNATNDYDDRYDGESFSANKYVDFYSVNNNRNFVIQGRALPFDENDIVPLGYTSQLGGTFSVGINDADGLLKTQNIFLEDKLLNVIHDLKTASYSFTTQKGTFDDRFVLRYTARTLGNESFDALSSQVIVSRDKNELKIKSDIETIKKVIVYDLLGKKVFEKNADSSNEFRSSTIGLSKQVGVVIITLDNGQVVSRKVSFY